ncbi:MAG: SGNH/GDSL hydrolase family protein [Acidimicrobiales bacterium]
MASTSVDRSKSWRRWRWVLAAGVVVALIGLGLVLSGSRDASLDPDTVIFGDSVTYLTGGALNNRFDHPHIVARYGFPTADLLPLVRQVFAQGVPSRVAVLAGYNDVFRSTVDSGALPEMMRETARADCVVWLTLPARTGGTAAPSPPYDPALVRLWNGRIEKLAARYPNVHVVHDWQKLVNRDASDLLEDRGVHPLAPGQRRLADVYRKGLDRSCR